MRLLFLTSRLPYPPDRGDRYRVFNFLRRLSAEHEIALVSFVASESERRYASILSEYCTTVHTVHQTFLRSTLSVARNVWRQEPMQALYYRSRAMRRKLTEIAETQRFDVVYIHLFRMAQYAHLFPGAYRIVDLTDAISYEIGQSLPYRRGFSRLLYRIEQPRIQRFESEVAEESDEVWVISERDRRVLASLCPEANLYVVPNGIDTAALRPIPIQPDPNRVLFVGNMGVPHNIDAVQHFADRILPLVLRQLPDVRFTVTGADPVQSIRALGDHPSVDVTGFVDDLNAALNEAAVFVAPLRFAAGVQTKVIEAMAAGRPVVTTRVVNEGIGAVPGRDLLVAEDAPSFAEEIVALCLDPERSREIGSAGRRFVADRFRWDAVAERIRLVGDR